MTEDDAVEQTPRNQEAKEMDHVTSNEKEEQAVDRNKLTQVNLWTELWLVLTHFQALSALSDENKTQKESSVKK